MIKTILISTEPANHEGQGESRSTPKAENIKPSIFLSFDLFTQNLRIQFIQINNYA